MNKVNIPHSDGILPWLLILFLLTNHEGFESIEFGGEEVPLNVVVAVALLRGTSNQKSTTDDSVEQDKNE